MKINIITDKYKIKKIFQESEEGEELWHAYQELDFLNKARPESNVSREIFNLEDIKQILDFNYKYQDNSIQVIGETEDNRFFSLIAGPEHPDSGWGASLVWLRHCIASSLPELLNYGLNQEERKRLNIENMLSYYEKVKFEESILINHDTKTEKFKI